MGCNFAFKWNILYNMSTRLVEPKYENNLNIQYHMITETFEKSFVFFSKQIFISNEMSIFWPEKFNWWRKKTPELVKKMTKKSRLKKCDLEYCFEVKRSTETGELVVKTKSNSDALVYFVCAVKSRKWIKYLHHHLTVSAACGRNGISFRHGRSTKWTQQILMWK